MPLSPPPPPPAHPHPPKKRKKKRKEKKRINVSGPDLHKGTVSSALPPVKKREDDKSTTVHSQSHTTVVESDLNRAGEDHPQRPEAVAESVTQTAMEVDEPVTVTVTVTMMPTPRVIADGEWTLISIWTAWQEESGERSS